MARRGDIGADIYFFGEMFIFWGEVFWIVQGGPSAWLWRLGRRSKEDEVEEVLSFGFGDPKVEEPPLRDLAGALVGISHWICVPGSPARTHRPFPTAWWVFPNVPSSLKRIFVIFLASVGQLCLNTAQEPEALRSDHVIKSGGVFRWQTINI